MPSPLEQALRQKLAQGGENLGLTLHDPLPSMGDASGSLQGGDPLTLLSLAVQGAFNPPPPPKTDPFVQAAELLTPRYLQEDYKGPQTGSYGGDLAAGFGELLQGGSAAGPLGGVGLSLAQLAGDLPVANKALGTLGGVKAFGANKQFLDAAQGLEAAGAAPDMIRKTTGWFKDADGNWKFEISNKEMGFTPDTMQALGILPTLKNGGKLPLAAIIGPADSTILNYPELADMPVRLMHAPGIEPGYTYSEGLYAQPWKTELGHDIPASIAIKSNTPKGFIDTLTHEIEHAVQNIEGWQGGGSPTAIAQAYHEAGKPLPMGSDLAREIYFSLLGEANARAATLRRQWPETTRLNIPIEWTRREDPYRSSLPGYFTQPLDPNVPWEQQLTMRPMLAR